MAGSDSGAITEAAEGVGDSCAAADDDAAIGIGDGRKRLSRPRWARGCFW